LDQTCDYVIKLNGHDPNGQMKAGITAFFLMALPLWGYAEEDDNKEVRTFIIKEGKVIREEHEVEVYDYHTGTFQTFKVYREPEADHKAKGDTPKPEPDGKSR